MKRIAFFFLLAFGCLFNSYGATFLQLSDTLPVGVSYKDTRLWRRHRACKISGWTALGVGGSMMIVGFVGDVLANYESPSYNPGFRIVGCIGSGITAASIPLFAFAVKNKQRAENAVLGTQLDPEHWKQYRRFRIGACTSLGVGLAGMLVGWAGGAFDDSWIEKNTGWKISFYAGAALTAGSIPLFVFAQRHKRAARQVDAGVSVGSTSLPVVAPSGIVGYRPALALRVNF